MLSVTGAQNYLVKKMKFLSKDRKDTIIFNNNIKIENIPSEAHEYIVSGKSAIEWIMDRYQNKSNDDTGIINDPNIWSLEVGNQKYILNLLLSIINMSMKTVEIFKSLPKLNFD